MKIYTGAMYPYELTTNSEDAYTDIDKQFYNTNSF